MAKNVFKVLNTFNELIIFDVRFKNLRGFGELKLPNKSKKKRKNKGNLVCKRINKEAFLLLLSFIKLLYENSER